MEKTTVRKRRVQILIGEKFGRLTVIKELNQKRYKCGVLVRMFKCSCSCGGLKIISFSSLRAGKNQSCGCVKSERTSRLKTTHNLSRTTEYKVWCGIKERCKNFNRQDYHRYGGRGITVCKRWEKFENFYRDMGKKPEGFSIDRINVNGNYEPSNCRWASLIDQANNRRDNSFFTYNGMKKTLSEWSRYLNFSYDLIKGRLRRGWEFKKAVETAKRKFISK